MRAPQNLMCQIKGNDYELKLFDTYDRKVREFIPLETE